MLRKKINWEELAPLPVGRSGHTAVLIFMSEEVQRVKVLMLNNPATD